MSDDEVAPPTAPRALRLRPGGEFEFGYLHVSAYRTAAIPFAEALLLHFEAGPGHEDVELVIRRDLLERQL